MRVRPAAATGATRAAPRESSEPRHPAALATSTSRTATLATLATSTTLTATLASLATASRATATLATLATRATVCATNRPLLRVWRPQFRPVRLRGAAVLLL